MRGLGRGSLKRADDGVWVGRWTDGEGRPHRVRLSDDPELADAILRDQVRLRDARAVSLGSLIERYVADLATRTKPSHVRNVGDQLRRVAAGLKAATTAELLAYRATRLRTPITYRGTKGAPPRTIAKLPSNSTVNAEIKAFSAMFDWAIDADLASENPAKRVKPLPTREAELRKRRRALTDDEIARMLAECRCLDAKRAVPQAPMWELMLTTGLRWGQVVALRPEDLRGSTLTVRAEAEKVGASREIPLPPALAGAVRLPFLTPRGKPYGANRSFALNQLKALARSAGVALVDANGRSLDLHGLRKTAASRYARRGVKAPALQRLLGHLDPRTTLRHYVELSLEDLRKSLGPCWDEAAAGAEPVAKTTKKDPAAAAERAD